MKKLLLFTLIAFAMVGCENEDKINSKVDNTLRKYAIEATNNSSETGCTVDYVSNDGVKKVNLSKKEMLEIINPGSESFESLEKGINDKYTKKNYKVYACLQLNCEESIEVGFTFYLNDDFEIIFGTLKD